MLDLCVLSSDIFTKLGVIPLPGHNPTRRKRITGSRGQKLYENYFQHVRIDHNAGELQRNNSEYYSVSVYPVLSFPDKAFSSTQQCLILGLTALSIPVVLKVLSPLYDRIALLRERVLLLRFDQLIFKLSKLKF